MIAAPRTAVLPILFLASLLSYLDRIIFSLALQPIKGQFGFSDSQLGLLAGLAFGVSYALFSPVAGWCADRRSRKVVLVVAIFGWSAATLATAFASSFAAMFAARALVGVGEAAVMPLAASLLSENRTPAQRSQAFALFLSASALGTLIGMIFGGALMAAVTRWGGLILPVLGALLPWQSLFVVAGASGFVFAISLLLIMREPRRAPRPTAALADDDRVWTFIAANPRLILTLYVGLSLIQMATVTNLVWIVPAFGRAHALAPAQAALSVGATAGIAMLIGCLAAGRVIARLRTGGESAAPLVVCVASGAIFAAFTAGGLLTSGHHISLALIAAGGLFAYAPTVSALNVVGEAVPAPIRARLAGFNTMSNALICNTLGSVLVGFFGDRLFSGKASVASALACVIILGLVLGGTIVLLGLREYRARLTLAPAGAA